jgi:hypothetical protein
MRNWLHVVAVLSVLVIVTLTWRASVHSQGTTSNRKPDNRRGSSDAPLPGETTLPGLTAVQSGVCGPAGCPSGTTCLHCPQYQACAAAGSSCCGTGVCKPGQNCIICPSPTGHICGDPGSQCCGTGLCKPGQTCLHCPGGGPQCAPQGASCCGAGYCAPPRRCVNGACR